MDRLLVQPSHSCLWPAPYDQDTLEAALRFVYDRCRTWDPTAGGAGIFPIPEMAHIERYADAWFEAKKTGGTLIVEKCRRMLISWVDRAITLHHMGLGRRSWVLSGETFAPACKHVWRFGFMYKDLQSRFKQWKLPDCRELHFEGPESLKFFGLANGSACNAMNGQGTSIQGEGQSGVTMEEASLYPFLQEMLGQAKIVTKGKAGGQNGMVVLIANPEPTYGWQVCKAGGKDFVGQRA